MTWLWVALAGGLGAVLRHLVHLGVHRSGSPSTRATLAVNILGSFGIGIAYAALLPSAPQAATILATGLLGGFTTFSTASVEARVVRRGRLVRRVKLLGARPGVNALRLGRLRRGSYRLQVTARTATSVSIDRARLRVR